MKLTVYTAPWCRDCHVAKRWLAQNNISFDEINIEETPGAAEEVIQRTGKRAIPQFVSMAHGCSLTFPEKASSMTRWQSFLAYLIRNYFFNLAVVLDQNTRSRVSSGAASSSLRANCGRWHVGTAGNRWCST